MSRILKQAAVVLALIICLPMAVFALIASSLIATVESLPRFGNDSE
jgi:hypothetical protein